jgi:hypothetical protein
MAAKKNGQLRLLEEEEEEDPCNHTASDLRLSSQSHRDRLTILVVQFNNFFMYI